MTWLKQGAIDDTKKDKITNFEKKQIKKFEEFLNNKKYKTSSNFKIYL